MKIFVAGHRGMVGGAILRRLEARKAAGEDLELVTRTSSELDLTSQAAVRDFMAAEKPDQVILAAARGRMELELIERYSSFLSAVTLPEPLRA